MKNALELEGQFGSNPYHNASNSTNISHLDQCYPRKNRRWAFIMKNKLIFSGQTSRVSTFPELVLLNEIQYFPKQSMSMGLVDLDQIGSTPMTDIDIDQGQTGQRPCDKDSGDFYVCLRPILVLGRILGILPLTGIFNPPLDLDNNKSLSRISFRWNSIPVLCSLVILLILGANTSLSFVNLFRLFAEGGGGNASQLAIAARSPMYYLMSFLIYIFFLFRGKALIKLFSKWRVVTGNLGFKNRDTKLSKHFWVLSGIIFGFGIFENALYTVNNFPISTRGANQTALEASFSNLETYYWRSHSYWATFLSYSPVLTILLLISNMVAAYAWNYADLFIVLCSRALYYKFKILVDQTTHQLLRKDSAQNLLTLGQNQNNQGHFQWTQVRKDHLTLCNLLEEFELFLSPLIFLSYSTNIFFICLEIHQGLTPQDGNSHLASAFSFCSFADLLLRVLLVSTTGAKVHEYVHQISTCIQRCNTNEYCSELERLERMLAAGPIGLSGLGCFVVTRAFLLMVVSVVFTVEIVLLQASATPQIQNQIQQGFSTTTEMPQ